MEDFKIKLNNLWARTKEFFAKKWLGLPIWVLSSGLVLILVLVALLMPKKKYK